MRIRSRDSDQGDIINISSMIDVMFILINLLVFISSSNDINQFVESTGEFLIIAAMLCREFLNLLEKALLRSPSKSAKKSSESTTFHLGHGACGSDFFTLVL